MASDIEREKALEQIIRQAGKIADRYFCDYQNIDKQVKTTGHDIVTAADREIERLIVSELSQKFPSDGFMGEENGCIEGSNYSCWVIDPIDGTANFARGIAYYSISIAYICKDQVLLGAVYDPCSNELYFAKKGAGASLNKQPISSSNTTWKQAVIALGRSERYDSAIHWDSIPQILDSGAEYRRLGSAALSLAHVGAGKLDAYYEYHLYPWDALAGLLIAQEAGAITKPNIDTLDLAHMHNWKNGFAVLAAGNTIWDQLETIVNFSDEKRSML